ncbi:universal stress protein family protein [Hephaestia caeni]|uniref:Universal stress protein family protein n=1 Tax=Hephaestia caeni TaxID=645617 RepID=A0A397PJR1_9SPHN|nr:universal stress protein [Hephaestia caeni]RIA46384.1 universal stress protein family protein [Hephaestia caeni]
MLKDLVAFVDNGEAAKPFLERSIAFAAVQDAHLAVTLLNDIFWDPGMLTPYEAYTGVLDEIEAEEARRLSEVRAAVEHAAIPVELRSFSDAPAYLRGAARLEGRYADLVLIGPPAAYRNPRLRRRCVESALMGSAGPVLISPEGTQLGKIDHVVLGWDASGEARRAAHDLLQIAESGARIDIIAVDAQPSSEGHGASPGADIARHLARHGFAAEVHLESSVGKTVAQVLEQFAIDRGANLLSIGAFAHSRVRDIFLGGVTRHLVEEARLPLLLSR